MNFIYCEDQRELRLSSMFTVSNYGLKSYERKKNLTIPWVKKIMMFKIPATMSLVFPGCWARPWRTKWIQNEAYLRIFASRVSHKGGSDNFRKGRNRLGWCSWVFRSHKNCIGWTLIFRLHSTSLPNWQHRSQP